MPSSDRKRRESRSQTWFALLATAAQAYHGGYNQALALGFSPEGRPLSDVDLVSAYTTALAFIRVPDWKSTRQTC